MRHQHKHIHRWKPVVGGFAFLAYFAVAPLVSHAIPIAGDYEFTNGIVGTFTSDGQRLTEWNFQVAGSLVTWTKASPIQAITNNDPDTFSAFQPGVTPLLSSGISLVWNNPFGAPRYFATDPMGAKTELLLYRPASAVPEPNSLVLLFVGLGLLAHYYWRHCSQTGLYVG